MLMTRLFRHNRGCITLTKARTGESAGSGGLHLRIKTRGAVRGAGQARHGEGARRPVAFGHTLSRMAVIAQGSLSSANFIALSMICLISRLCSDIRRSTSAAPLDLFLTPDGRPDRLSS
jgi:hypothetical protein